MPTDHFPHGIYLSKFLGHVTVRNVAYNLDRVIAEQHFDEINARRGVFEATEIATNRKVIIVAHFELDPSAIPADERLPIECRLRLSHNRERDALIQCGPEINTPELLHTEELTQSPMSIYPGGLLLVIVMSKVPGISLDDLVPPVTDGEKALIKRELATIIENLRLRGVLYGAYDSGHIHFDRPTEQVYLTGFGICSFGHASTTRPITVDSFKVNSFGLWH